jgi:hypothetical protein
VEEDPIAMSSTVRAAGPQPIRPIPAGALLLALALGCGCAAEGDAAPGPLDPAEAQRQIGEVLDALHDAASRADGEGYFGQFALDAVFLGTDPAERWTVAQFRDYVMPYFNRDVGWTYLPRPDGRNIQVSADGRMAWFDEVLDNEKYGECRGTGVLRRDGNEWKIVQYSLSLPIPNDLTGDVVDLIRAYQGGVRK